jgi:rhodanese-related sulfurtransferase
MDPLSEVLRSVRLTGGVFLQAHFTAPWCVTANMDAGDVTPFMAATPAQLIGYHVVLEGELLVSIGDEPSVKARAGEVLLFPRNDGHVLASAPGVKPVGAGTLIQPGSDGLLRIAHGGGGAATRIVCGFLASEEGYNPLIAALPRVLTLDVREGTSRDWIEASVRFAASELAAGRLASSSVMSRLSETLLRRHLRARCRGRLAHRLDHAGRGPQARRRWRQARRPPSAAEAAEESRADRAEESRADRASAEADVGAVNAQAAGRGGFSRSPRTESHDDQRRRGEGDQHTGGARSAWQDDDGQGARPEGRDGDQQGRQALSRRRLPPAVNRVRLPDHVGPAATHHDPKHFFNTDRSEDMTISIKQLLATANAAVSKITPAQARDMIGQGNTLVVDVRDPTEVANTGKIAGAANVSRGMLEFRADPESPYHDKAFARDKTVILYCASGGRSALAGKVLKDMGYAQVFNLGAFKDWAESGGAVDRPA